MSPPSSHVCDFYIVEVFLIRTIYIYASSSLENIVLAELPNVFCVTKKHERIVEDTNEAEENFYTV